MTAYLYQTDSYLKEFDSVVTSSEELTRSLTLEKSAFYPGGGGQLCDFGEISQNGCIWQVERVRKGTEGAEHLLGGAMPIPAVGSTVHGRLDWERRYQLMRTHTAMHILCGTIFRDFGAQVTGGDMEPLKGRMDFEFESMTRDLVSVIEESVNLEAMKAHPVKVQILPRDEAFRIPDLIRTKINLLPPDIQYIRVVELVGLDLQADGGTHVHNTSEVGRIRVVDYKSKGKINKRIYVELD
jgi:misacylated tRNA(Ala) deacylase